MSKLYFRYSAMNAGKTTALLQVAHNYEERGMHVKVIKPWIDREVDILLSEEDSVLSYFTEEVPNAIIVDEAQFLTPEQVDEFFYLSKVMNVPVLCYGLRTDFQMNGFPGAIRLLEIADDIEELKTVCRCGKKATLNMRFINGIPTFSGSQVAIDNGENAVSYESVCGECYILNRKKKMNKIIRKEEENETI